MIRDLAECMGDDFVTLHGDIMIKLDPLQGLAVSQGSQMVVFDPAQLAHLNRVVAGMVKMGSHFGSQRSPSMTADPVESPE